MYLKPFVIFSPVSLSLFRRLLPNLMKTILKSMLGGERFVFLLFSSIALFLAAVTPQTVQKDPISIGMIRNRRNCMCSTPTSLLPRRREAQIFSMIPTSIRWTFLCLTTISWSFREPPSLSRNVKSSEFMVSCRRLSWIKNNRLCA